MSDLPELGVGMIYWPGIDHLVRAASDAIDVIEVEPQPFWFSPKPGDDRYRVDMRALEHLQGLPKPKLVHGVGFPVGGTIAPRPGHLDPFVESVVALGSPWASEHLSFNRVRKDGDELDVGFLMPPLQSPDGVATAAANIRAVKERLPVPFAFETGVSYLRPQAGELPDGAFFAEVAEKADCGILLDLHNVWANERNGRQPVLELVDELPLDRVWEVHVAGGQELDGIWVDAHSALPPPEVLDLARHIVPRLRNLRAIIFEIMPEYAIEYGLEPGDLVRCLLDLRETWTSRGSAAPSPGLPADVERRGGPVTTEAAGLPGPRGWEEALTDALWQTSTTPDHPRIPAGLDLTGDPGLAVLRRLIGAARAGKLATALRLSTRLLLLTLGDRAVGDLLDKYCRCVPSELTASDEAKRFADFARRDTGDSVPFLPEVLAIELATNRAFVEGQPQQVALGCDPRALVSALREGRLPEAVERGDFQLTVEAPLATRGP